MFVRRLTLAVLLTLLALSASGAPSMFVPEPCGSNEPVRSHSVCPPTCVTCGCCAQAAEPVLLSLTSSPEVLLTGIVDSLPRLPKAAPRDILHVPKLRLA